MSAHDFARQQSHREALAGDIFTSSVISLFITSVRAVAPRRREHGAERTRPYEAYRAWSGHRARHGAPSPMLRKMAGRHLSPAVEVPARPSSRRHLPRRPAAICHTVCHAPLSPLLRCMSSNECCEARRATINTSQITSVSHVIRGGVRGVDYLMKCCCLT